MRVCVSVCLRVCMLFFHETCSINKACFSCGMFFPISTQRNIFCSDMLPWRSLMAGMQFQRDEESGSSMTCTHDRTLLHVASRSATGPLSNGHPNHSLLTPTLPAADATTKRYYSVFVYLLTSYLLMLQLKTNGNRYSHTDIVHVTQALNNKMHTYYVCKSNPIFHNLLDNVSVSLFISSNESEARYSSQNLPWFWWVLWAPQEKGRRAYLTIFNINHNNNWESW